MVLMCTYLQSARTSAPPTRTLVTARSARPAAVTPATRAVPPTGNGTVGSAPLYHYTLGLRM